MTVSRSVLVRLRAEMAQFKKEWNDGTGAVKGTREELGRASKQAKQTSQDLDSSGTTVGKLSKNLREHRKEWDLVGTSLLKSGAALTAVSALMAKAAIDWETAWAGVTKTVTGTPAELAAVEQGLRDLAKSMPESHTQIAAVAEAAGQLGIHTEDIVAFTRNMVMLGDTTNLSAEEAATSIAQLMNVMQTAPGDVDRLSSTLVALGNSGASTERDIIQMAQRIAGAGEIVGLSEANVLSLANALSSSGIEVEAGGSAISNVLIDISKAVDTGSAKLDTFAKVAGTTAEDFSARWKADPASALADFTEGLGRMAANGENVFGTLEELGQSDVRVTRALLNMANAGDLLRDSLAAGDAAWQKNTALVAEAEKRYDTTAAKAKIAWNNIKDNAIDAGQGLLPVISSVSDVVVDLGDAFGALPGPVKGALGVLAGGTGIALLTAGAFLKVVGTASDLRAAMVSLDASGSRGARGLGRLGKAAGAVAIALAALQVADELIPDAKVKSTGKYAEAILQIGSNAGSARKEIDALFTKKASGFWGADVKGLADALHLVSRSGASKTLENIESGFGALESAGSLAEESITKYDHALTSLVQSGATDEAARGAKLFADEAKKAGLDSDRVAELLPEYSEALQDAANEQKLAGDSAKKLGDDSSGLAMRLAELSPNAEEAKQKLDELEQGTADAAMGFLDMSAKIDASKTSFDGWLKDLEAQHRAMEDWADNLVKAAQRGVSDGVIKEFEKMGPEGAKRLAELVDASDEEIARLNAVFSEGGADAQRLAEILNAFPRGVITEFKTAGAPGAIQTAIEVAARYGMTPDQVQTILEALDYTKDDIRRVTQRLRTLNNIKARPTISVIDAATGKIRQIQEFIDGMHGTTVKIAVEGGTPGGITRNAEGGAITGPGGPKEDNLLSWVSSGEHVWTAAEVDAVGGQSAMYAMRAAVRAGRKPQFADGGAGSDAWNASYRTAAAAYGAPVRSVQAAPPVVVNAGREGPSELGGASVRAMAQAVQEAVMAGMHGATFQQLPDGTVRLILRGGR